MYATTRLALAAAAAALLAAILAVAAPGSGVLAAGAADAVLLVLLAFDVRGAPPARTLRIARVAPGVARLRRRATVAVVVHNPTARPLRVELRDASPPSLGRAPIRHRATLAAGGWVRLAATVTPERRGMVALGPLTVRTSGPLGLGGRQETLALPGRLKVYPPLPSRAEVELRLERARLLQSGERSSAVRGGGTEFDSTREYHPDDEFRRINWKATARAAKAISNVYRQERNQQVLLLLDASRMMAASLGGFSRFEHGIDAAVAVAELAARVGDHVGMVAFGRQVVASVGPRTGRAQARRLLDALFDLEPSLDAPNYRLAFARLLARYRRRALLVLLTELTEEAALEALFAAIPALLSRHLVIVGSVVDPELEAAAASEPASSEEVFLKAAAVGALEARQQAARRLRRMGVVVVDEPPGRLAGRLADEYLRIKAFGRL